MMFQPDIVISWDFSEKDYPVVSISRLRSNEKATGLECDVLYTSSGDCCGVVSVRQLMEEFDAMQRAEREQIKEADD